MDFENAFDKLSIHTTDITLPNGQKILSELSFTMMLHGRYDVGIGCFGHKAPTNDSSTPTKDDSTA